MSNFKTTTIFKIVEILLVIIVMALDLFTSFLIKPIPSIIESGIYHAYIPILFGLILNDLNDGELGIVNLIIVYLIAVIGFASMGIMDLLYGTGTIKATKFVATSNDHLAAKGVFALIFAIICLIDFILQLIGGGGGGGGGGGE